MKSSKPQTPNSKEPSSTNLQAAKMAFFYHPSLRFPVLIFLIVTSVVPSSAQDGTIVLDPTKPNAPRIVREAITNQPIHDYRLDGRLELTSADGAKKKLGIIILGRPVKDYSNVKTIIRVTSPSDVAGATLMVWQTDHSPNQIFYRGSGASEPIEIQAEKNRERFLDTDFSYEDVNFSFLRWAKQETFKPDEKRVARWCHVVKSTPTSSDGSQYAYVISWIDREALAPLVAEGYDAQGKLLKKLTVKGFRRDGGGWSVSEMTVEDLLRGHRTKLVIEKGDFHIEHPDELFTREKFFLELPRAKKG